MFMLHRIAFTYIIIHPNLRLVNTFLQVFQNFYLARVANMQHIIYNVVVGGVLYGGQHQERRQAHI